MKDIKYTCKRAKKLEELKENRNPNDLTKKVIKIFEAQGCNYCSGNYSECDEYIPTYE